MKILSIADIVVPVLYPDFDAERFKGVDFVLGCGDLPPEYLAFLANTLEVPLYYVRGNHDLRYANSPPGGCLDLHNKLVRVNNLNILGLEGSRWYNGGPQQYTDSQMAAIVRRLRFKLWRKGGPDIIVTHAPPRNVHDEEDLCHRGFKTYLGLIKKYQPQYFIHGHIHRVFADNSERITVLNTTSVINAYGYYVIEI
ncbi:MAG: metallophosphoesterase [Desulfobacterales bacterium]|nr:metallophosphoesterase [Desulfobacterales bacterium]